LWAADRQIGAGSTGNQQYGCQPERGGEAAAHRPPSAAPRAKAAMARRLATIEISPTPAKAKPRKTTFPVMFATNTCPSLR
jgi:hypothetical protein